LPFLGWFAEPESCAATIRESEQMDRITPYISSDLLPFQLSRLCANMLLCSAPVQRNCAAYCQQRPMHLGVIVGL
jgi:hypothetical protein